MHPREREILAELVKQGDVAFNETLDLLWLEKRRCPYVVRDIIGRFRLKYDEVVAALEAGESP